jgi:hypothetical protein
MRHASPATDEYSWISEALVGADGPPNLLITRPQTLEALDLAGVIDVVHGDAL